MEGKQQSKGLRTHLETKASKRADLGASSECNLATGRRSATRNTLRSGLVLKGSYARHKPVYRSSVSTAATKSRTHPIYTPLSWKLRFFVPHSVSTLQTPGASLSHVPIPRPQLSTALGGEFSDRRLNVALQSTGRFCCEFCRQFWMWAGNLGTSVRVFQKLHVREDGECGSSGPCDGRWR